MFVLESLSLRFLDIALQDMGVFPENTDHSIVEEGNFDSHSFSTFCIHMQCSLYMYIYHFKFIIVNLVMDERIKQRTAIWKPWLNFGIANCDTKELRADPEILIKWEGWCTSDFHYLSENHTTYQEYWWGGRRREDVPKRARSKWLKR